MTYKSTRKTRILWAGKRRADIPSFVPDLENRGYKVTFVSTGKDALLKLNKRKPDVMIIDAASMRTTGSRICKSIQVKYPSIPIILINSPENLPTNEIVAEIQLVHPFTIRKLENRIIPFSPGDGDEIIKAGPIHLDMDRQVIRCNRKEEHITPRMAELLKMLIKQKGEVLDRRKMFSRIWKTDYTEDTRSLDVHINWLRKIVEKDPDHPILILTIRGKGYKLDL
ncbi:MAG: response regulator transcription factor [Anaerolineales bacterium]|nr:response regulator transcription factor [Anaerolineales bacterium]